MVLVVTSCYRGRNVVCETRTPFRLAHVNHFPRAYWAPLATSPSRPGPMPTCILLRIPVGSVAICSEAVNTSTQDPICSPDCDDMSQIRDTLPHGYHPHG